MLYFGKVSVFLLSLFLMTGCNEAAIKPEEKAPQPAIVIKEDKPSTTPKPLAISKTYPRISIVAPAKTYVNITVNLDNNLVCTINGLIDANHHRTYQTRYIAEGVCASKAIKTQGTHSYQLKGYIVLPNGIKHDVNLNTDRVNLQDVYEPIIDVQPNGRVQLELTIG